MRERERERETEQYKTWYKITEKRQKECERVRANERERESGIDFLLPSILLEVMLQSHLQTFQRSTPPSKDSRTEQKKLTIKNLLGGKLLIVKK